MLLDWRGKFLTDVEEKNCQSKKQQKNILAEDISLLSKITLATSGIPGQK